MSYSTIRRLLEQHLVTNSVGIETAWENVPYKPGTAMWQEVALLPARPENPTLGDAFRRETGIFQISVHAPLNVGPQVAQARADALLAAFARGLMLFSGTLRVMIDASPFIGPSVRGEWFTIVVSVPYVADVHG